MENILLGLCLLSVLTGYVYCTFTETNAGLTIECPDSNHRLPPKGDFIIRCSTTGDVQDIIVGKKLVYGKVDQKTQISTDNIMRADGLPYIVYNDSLKIEPKLEELAPGRYTVDTDGTSVSVSVSDAKPEDSGVWVCGTTTMTKEDYVSAVDCNILVVGGVQNISFYNPESDDIYENSLVIEPNVESGPIGIEIIMANVAPDEVEIRINGKDVTSDFSQTPNSVVTVYDGGYVTYKETTKYEGTFQVDEDSKSSSVRVMVSMSPLGGLTTESLSIFSKGKPFGASCVFDREGDGAVISCEAKMVPVGNVTWSTPIGDDIVVNDKIIEQGNMTFENTVEDPFVKSTLTIAVWEDSYSQETFKATFKNEYGEDSASFTEMQVAGGMNTMATLPLVVFLVLLTYFI